MNNGIIKSKKKYEKVLAITGLRQEDMMPMYDGLRPEISKIPADYVVEPNERDIRMDEYLEKNNL